VAGKNRPSYLKKQKEQQRRARADEKRNRRLTRKQQRSDRIEPTDSIEAPDPMNGDAVSVPGETDEPRPS
jgi:hypothetical protein